MPDDADAKKPPLRAVPVDQVRSAKGTKRVAVQRNKVAGTKAFRRMRADRIWGVVGVFFVVWGLWLVFNWEPPVEVDPKTSVTWPESVNTRENQTLELVRGAGPLEHVISVPEANITELTARVSWVDDVGDQSIEWDVLRFNLTGPEGTGIAFEQDGQADHVDGTEIIMTFRVSPIPDTRSVPTDDRQEAARLLGDQSNRTGTGDWVLRASLVTVGDDFPNNNSRLVMGECPQQTGSVPDPTGLNCTYDPGQSFTLAVEYKHYRHEFPQE